MNSPLWKTITLSSGGAGVTPAPEPLVRTTRVGRVPGDWNGWYCRRMRLLARPLVSLFPLGERGDSRLRARRGFVSIGSEDALMEGGVAATADASGAGLRVASRWAAAALGGRPGPGVELVRGVRRDPEDPPSASPFVAGLFLPDAAAELFLLVDLLLVTCRAALTVEASAVAAALVECFSDAFLSCCTESEWFWTSSGVGPSLQPLVAGSMVQPGIQAVHFEHQRSLSEAAQRCRRIGDNLATLRCVGHV